MLNSVEHNRAMKKNKLII